MSTTNTAWDYKNLKPVTQAGIVIGILLLFNVFSMAGISDDGNGLFQKDIFWINCIAMVLLFILFNSILSVFAVDQNKYWLHSLLSFVALCVIGGLMAYGFSGLGMDEAGSFRWLYFVLTFGYLIFLSIMRTIRKIVEIAQKQDSRLRGEE